MPPEYFDRVRFLKIFATVLFLTKKVLFSSSCCSWCSIDHCSDPCWLNFLQTRGWPSQLQSQTKQNKTKRPSKTNFKNNNHNRQVLNVFKVPLDTARIVFRPGFKGLGWTQRPAGLKDLRLECRMPWIWYCLRFHCSFKLRWIWNELNWFSILWGKTSK